MKLFKLRQIWFNEIFTIHILFRPLDKLALNLALKFV